MKKSLVLLVSILLILSSCRKKTRVVYVNQQPTQQVVDEVLPGQNFDLRAVTEICKTTTDPAALEQIINGPNGINNLDLDQNGNVDYIKVTEYGRLPVIGLSFTPLLSDGEPELGSIEINTSTREVNIYGNEMFYGPNYYYSFYYNPNQYRMFTYLSRPHTFYVSSYRYGYYPRYYTPYVRVGYNSYTSRSHVSSVRSSSTYKKTTTRKTSNIKSPNSKNISKTASSTAKKKSEAVAKKTNRSVSNATTSQKSMNARDKDKSIGGGGFTSNKTNTTSNNKVSKTQPTKTSSSTKINPKYNTTSSSSSYKKPTSTSSSSYKKPNTSSSYKKSNTSKKSSGFSSSKSKKKR